MASSTEQQLTNVKIHKVPDLTTWETAYGVPNGIGTDDLVTFNPNTIFNEVLKNSEEIFVATYGSTTIQQIYTEYQANKLIICYYGSIVYVLTNCTQATAHFCAAVTPFANSSSVSVLGLINDNNTWVTSQADLGYGNFVAIYGNTTTAELEAAWQSRKIIGVKFGDDYLATTCQRKVSANRPEFYFRFFGSNVGQGEVGSISCINNTWSSTGSEWAVKDSPGLTGTPTAPTAPTGTNTTQIATTAFVQQEKDIVLIDDSTTYNDVQTIINNGKKPVYVTQNGELVLLTGYDQSRYVFTSNDYSPTTGAVSIFHMELGSTGWINNRADSIAKLNSPELIGTPTAPTPTSGDNSTKLATTAFVQNAINEMPTFSLFTATIPTTATWTPDVQTLRYTTDITVSGLPLETADSLFLVRPITVNDAKAWGDNSLYCEGTPAINTLRFSCTTVPNVNVEINIAVFV